MEKSYIPQEERKKILLICDDIRMHSGVSTMAREIVMGTAGQFNWVNLGAGINHPDAGKKMDLCASVNKEAGIEDASVFIYPNNNYGDANLVRRLIQAEKPDAIMLFTDPRYFVWLFQMEDEIRSKMPIIYYNIWDDAPAPIYNKAYYESCDLIMAISKQTENLNRIVLDDKAKEKMISYVPHGINEKMFKPLNTELEKAALDQYRTKIFNGEEYDFVVFWNSRNIHRKHPSDVLLAYKHFVDSLPEENRKKCVLIMHTDPVDNNGTDLPAVKDLLFGDDDNYRVAFSPNKITPAEMCMMYNIADVTMLISSNEGWGLSLTESMLCGTPIIANVTGGMQDQMRFEDDEGNWITFDESFLSNHFGTYTSHGDWAYPVFPSNISLAGSVPTPYIYDDRCDARDVAEQLKKVYNLTKEEREADGMAGHEWATGDEAGFTARVMCERMAENINKLFDTWKPRPKYEIIQVQDIKPKKAKHPLVY